MEAKARNCLTPGEKKLILANHEYIDEPRKGSLYHEVYCSLPLYLLHIIQRVSSLFCFLIVKSLIQGRKEVRALFNK